MTEFEEADTFTDAEVIVIGRFLLAALTLEQSLKWWTARYEQGNRAGATVRAYVNKHHGRRLDRATSTVSREVNANGGRTGYRAVAAEASVAVRAPSASPQEPVTGSDSQSGHDQRMTLTGRVARC